MQVVCIGLLQLDGAISLVIRINRDYQTSISSLLCSTQVVLLS